MSGFSADWLALREPFDRAARSAHLMRSFAALLPSAPRVVDLGAGNGANVRALAPLLPVATRWRIVDRDPALLALAPRACAGIDLACERRDLASDLDAAIGDADGVTAAALADLVSSAWLDRLFAIAQRRRIPVLVALTADGAPVLDPPAAGDAAVLAAFAIDQARDKGFGRALGADATGALIAAAARHGYAVESAHSDWQIEAGDRVMLEAVLGFIADAAGAAQPGLRAHVDAWRAARRGEIASGGLRMRVGHRDVLAYAASRA